MKGNKSTRTKPLSPRVYKATTTTHVVEYFDNPNSNQRRPVMIPHSRSSNELRPHRPLHDYRSQPPSPNIPVLRAVRRSDHNLRSLTPPTLHSHANTHSHTTHIHARPLPPRSAPGSGRTTPTTPRLRTISGDDDADTECARRAGYEGVREDYIQLPRDDSKRKKKMSKSERLRRQAALAARHGWLSFLKHGFVSGNSTVLVLAVIAMALVVLVGITAGLTFALVASPSVTIDSPPFEMEFDKPFVHVNASGERVGRLSLRDRGKIEADLGDGGAFRPKTNVPNYSPLWGRQSVYQPLQQSSSLQCWGAKQQSGNDTDVEFQRQRWDTDSNHWCYFENMCFHRNLAYLSRSSAPPSRQQIAKSRTFRVMKKWPWHETKNGHETARMRLSEMPYVRPLTDKSAARSLEVSVFTMSSMMDKVPVGSNAKDRNNYIKRHSGSTVLLLEGDRNSEHLCHYLDRVGGALRYLNSEEPDVLRRHMVFLSKHTTHSTTTRSSLDLDDHDLYTETVPFAPFFEEPFLPELERQRMWKDPFAPDSDSVHCYERGVIGVPFMAGECQLSTDAEEWKLLKSTIFSHHGLSAPSHARQAPLITLIARSHTRRILNPGELLDPLNKRFFTTQLTYLEDLPMKKQIELLSETFLLIGVYGQGLSLMQFLPPNAGVIQILPHGMSDIVPNNEYQAMAQRLGLVYRELALDFEQSRFHASLAGISSASELKKRLVGLDSNAKRSVLLTEQDVIVPTEQFASVFESILSDVEHPRRVSQDLAEREKVRDFVLQQQQGGGRSVSVDDSLTSVTLASHEKAREQAPLAEVDDEGEVR